MATITAGDTRPFVATLKIGDAIVPLDVSDTVTMEIVDPKTKVAITLPWTSASDDPGAVWAQGKVSVVIPDAESVKLDAFADKDILLVIQVESLTLGKKEWQQKYKVQKGYIL
jgi:hypothetical protein